MVPLLGGAGGGTSAAFSLREPLLMYKRVHSVAAVLARRPLRTRGGASCEGGAKRKRLRRLPDGGSVRRVSGLEAASPLA
ncbi:hypothetical protein GCM10023222_13480 [Saccharopolyspora cebuensis]